MNTIQFKVCLLLVIVLFSITLITEDVIYNNLFKSLAVVAVFFAARNITNPNTD